LTQSKKQYDKGAFSNVNLRKPLLGKRDKSELALKPEFSVLSALASLAKSVLGGTRQAPKSS
jgi:hypothetical protein